MGFVSRSLSWQQRQRFLWWRRGWPDGVLNKISRTGLAQVGSTVLRGRASKTTKGQRLLVQQAAARCCRAGASGCGPKLGAVSSRQLQRSSRRDTNFLTLNATPNPPRRGAPSPRRKLDMEAFSPHHCCLVRRARRQTLLCHHSHLLRQCRYCSPPTLAACAPALTEQPPTSATCPPWSLQISSSAGSFCKAGRPC